MPSRFQAAVEFVVELVEDQSKAIVHGDRSFIAPLALAVFLWVSADELDGLPAGRYVRRHLPPLGIHNAEGHEPFFRAVPTADLNGTFGMALVVLP